jgi:hypothetical protein
MVWAASSYKEWSSVCLASIRAQISGFGATVVWRFICLNFNITKLSFYDKPE